MSLMLLVGLLLGFFVGVGAAVIWAVWSTAACHQPRVNGQLAAEAEAVMCRLDSAAAQVRALMLDVLRGQK
jgi:hypothetical protein